MLVESSFNVIYRGGFCLNERDYDLTLLYRNRNRKEVFSEPFKV